jgi:copper chaperone CopZ
MNFNARCKEAACPKFIYLNSFIMKTIKFSLLIFLSFIGAQIGGQAYAQQISNAELQVTGLTCSMCAKATETALRRLDFIESIKPDLNKNLFSLSFKDNKKVNLDQIRKKVEEAGFSVGQLTATFNFNNVKVDDKGIASVDGNTYRFTNSSQKTLNGPVKATVVDKDFISGASFKKNLAALKLSSYASGTTIVDGRKLRVYHLSI